MDTDDGTQGKSECALAAEQRLGERGTGPQAAGPPTHPTAADTADAHPPPAHTPAHPNGTAHSQNARQRNVQ